MGAKVAILGAGAWGTAVAKAIADTGFTGYFAHEFIPLRDWQASLKQAVQICTV